jgi:hypothetical protein
MTVRVVKSSRLGSMGDPRWIVYEGEYFTGLTIERDRFFAKGHYRLYKNGEFQRRFDTLKAARLWLNQSELERIVSAIG